MSTHRTSSILTALAVIAIGLTIGAPAADAAPTLTPSRSSVAVGSAFTTTVSGCPNRDGESGTSSWSEGPEARLLTGSGADRRLAALGDPVSETQFRFRVAGWVDPAQPAALAGRCVRTTYDYETDTQTTETLFSYPDAAVDIVAGSSAVTGPRLTLSRSTAASGQQVRGDIEGCEGTSFAQLVLLEGDDLTLGGDVRYITGGAAEVTNGRATIDLTLLRPSYVEDAHGVISQGLEEGSYTVLALCAGRGATPIGQDTIVSSPQLLTVSGTNPSEAIAFEVGDDAITVTGQQCTGGRTVSLTYQSEGTDLPMSADRDRGEAVARRDLSAAAKASEATEPASSAADPGADGGTLEATPDADGNWQASVPIDDALLSIEIEVHCGDPMADGFSYGVRSFFLGGMSADVYVDRISPTSSPAGGPVAAHLYGECETGATVTVSRDGEIVAESTSAVPSWNLPSEVTFTAPSSPGTYQLLATCDGDIGDSVSFEVFTPDPVSAAAPLPAEPTSGWPSEGGREVYHGKIGPIVLPPMETEEMGEMDAAASSTRAMGPSGLFIDVPKPEGDFAITKIDMNLVDGQGATVPATSAHLHHFVFGAANRKNPGCPDGSTFGIPGSIIGAAGAEKTVLNLGDPYGMVVDAKDQWKGVYELMSRSMERQEVYLTYDITYRRDVANVRPVSRYFGSATGCGSFSWTVDGSGTPDVQSTYIQIGKAGRLIGGGAHIHNGGAYADLVNDRGRRLCRSEITYGDDPVGHAMSMSGDDSDASATTTMVTEPMPPDEGPPEFYDDDMEIDAISSCALRESVSAGERIRLDVAYENDRPRAGVMGIYTLLVWEGGGPAAPGAQVAEARPAQGIPGRPQYTG